VNLKKSRHIGFGVFIVHSSMFLGSYLFSATAVSIVEHQRRPIDDVIDKYRVVWQEETEEVLTSMFDVRLDGTTFALLGQQGGLLTLYDLSKRVRVKSAPIFGADEEIFRIFYTHLQGDGPGELLVLGRKSSSSPSVEVSTLVVLQVPEILDVFCPNSIRYHVPFFSLKKLDVADFVRSGPN
jgi:hypothetical protein